jgi:hypothetical protein
MTDLYRLSPLAVCGVFAAGVTVGILVTMALDWATERRRR